MDGLSSSPGLIIFLIVLITSTPNPGETKTKQCQPIPSYPSALLCDGYSRIPRDLPNKHNLTYLEMGFGSNSIKSLKNGSLLLAELPQLEKLSLENCKIERIDDGAFTGGDKLVELLLSHNLIKTMDPSVFKPLKNLKLLWLQGNPIKELEAPFPPNLKLTHLYLHLCEISFVSENVFRNLKELKSLDLWQNNLSTLNWKIFRGLENLEMVPLGRNPWHCDCHVKFLMEFFLERKIQWETNNEHEPECVGDLLTWKTWNDLRNGNETLSCPPEISSLTISQRNVRSSVIFSRSEEAYVECNYSGYPEPEVEWFKDGEILNKTFNNSSNKYRTKLFLVQDKNSSEVERRFGMEFRQELIISKVGRNDEGLYTCGVITPAGNVSREIWLTSSCLVPDTLLLVLLLAVAIIIVLGVATVLIRVCERFNERKRENFLIREGTLRSLRSMRSLNRLRPPSDLTQRPSAPNVSDESAQSFL